MRGRRATFLHLGRGGVNVLDIFSGIGGFSLGLERAGMRTIAFCEIDPFCRAVLRKHWPSVPIHEDVRFLHARHIRERVDVICGGFPCQDISYAGAGAGIDGQRSGLWTEYARLVGEFRPLYVIVENVAALLGRGIERVLGDLAALGYDAEWHCIPASAVGAPHRRDRVWIVAYPDGHGRDTRSNDEERAEGQALGAVGAPSERRSDKSRADALANADRIARRLPTQAREGCAETSGNGEDVADATGTRRQGRHEPETARQSHTDAARRRRSISDANSKPTQRLAIAWGECSQWLTEPEVGRVANGVTSRVDRLRAIGNAVVPQIPEIIGRAIMRAEGLSS